MEKKLTESQKTKLMWSKTLVESSPLNKAINCSDFDLYITEIVWETIIRPTGLKKSKFLDYVQWCASPIYGEWTVKLGGGGASYPTIHSDGEEYIVYYSYGISSTKVYCIEMDNPYKYYIRANVVGNNYTQRSINSTVTKPCW